MMKKFCALLSAVLLCGCVSVEYDGECAAARDGDVPVVVFTDATRIDRPYTVLGKASASGNYQEVSRDRMIAKLREKAASCGADAMLIVEQQVIAGDPAVTSNPVFSTSFDFDSTDGNWRQVTRDLDRDFVNTRRNRTSTTAGSINNFRRIIRVEFLRWKENGSPAPAAKKPAEPAGK